MLLSYSTFISAVLTTYALTFVVASSSLFAPIRRFIIKKTPLLKIEDYKHFIECRMCLGFWVSILVCGVYGNITDFLVVYGLSYFLATQER